MMDSTQVISISMLILAYINKFETVFNHESNDEI